jgi:xylulokinase
LVFLPYLQGERTPNLPHGCGVLHGMTTSNSSPGHLARAAMEGVTLGMAYGLRRMESLGLRPGEIRLTGGGSQSPVWRQLCADIFGCPVVTLQNSEGAALGAAMQALAQAAGQRLQDLCTVCAPIAGESRLDPRTGFDYAALLEKQNQLRQRLFS